VVQRDALGAAHAAVPPHQRVLWQEGHTAHETEAEAQEETLKMLDVYVDFAENVLAVPVIKGAKTDAEKFPGAKTTYCFEGLMQDGKALQMGTSHNLGQKFFQGVRNQIPGAGPEAGLRVHDQLGRQHAADRAMIMAHSDDEGSSCRRASRRTSPPSCRSTRARKMSEGARLRRKTRREAGRRRRAQDQPARYGELPFQRRTEQRIVVDFRDSRPGDKHYHWEQRGVPFRFEVGPRDVDAGTLVLKSRLGAGAKEIIKLDDIASPQWLQEKLDAAHAALFEKAKKYRDDNTRRASTYDEMKKILLEQGGFVRCYFIPDRGNEAKIKEETKATVRCIPFDQPSFAGQVHLTPARRRRRKFCSRRRTSGTLRPCQNRGITPNIPRFPETPRACRRHCPRRLWPLVGQPLVLGCRPALVGSSDLAVGKVVGR
jgi:prolyl-tRNA synthetase